MSYIKCISINRDLKSQSPAGRTTAPAAAHNRRTSGRRMGETWRNAPRPQGQNCREHLESCFRPIHIGDICDINIMPQIVCIYMCVCVWIICVWYVFVSTILYIINYMSCMHKSEQFPCGPCLIIWVAWMLGLCMDHPAGHVEGQWSHVAYQIWQWNRAWEHQTPLHTFTLFSMSSVKLSEQYRTPTG